MCDYSLHAIASRPAKVGDAIVDKTMETLTVVLPLKVKRVLPCAFSLAPNSPSTGTSNTIATGF